jgi:4-amino-4-deoxy-L-arabinose transferase-like glycosyltransferase
MSLLRRLEGLKPGRWWLLLVSVALVARLAWVAALPTRRPVFDERQYIAHATRLAEGKGYTDDAGRPTAYWPVGYPALLSVCCRATARDHDCGVLLQIVLGVAACVLVSLIGNRAFGPRIGRGAALLLALYPNQVFYSTLNLTEPLYTVLLLASTLLLLKSAERGVALNAAAGLTLGLAALVRPVICLFPLALLCWYRRLGWPFSKALGRTVLAGTCMLIAVSPWLVRNHKVTGSWTVLSTTGGHNLWIGNHPGALGGYYYPKAINEQLRNGDGYDFSRGYRLGLDAIAATPLQAALRVFQKVSYFFALETDGVLWNLKGLARPAPTVVKLGLLGVVNAAYLFVLSFSVLGLMGTPRGQPLSSLFLVLTAYSVLITAVFIGDPRYHYALVPLAAVFSVKGVADEFPSLRKGVQAADPHARRRLRLWCAVMLVFLALMCVNLGLKALESRL